MQNVLVNTKCLAARKNQEHKAWSNITSNMRRWDMSISDVAGCLDLSSPRPADSCFKLEDVKCPVYHLVGELAKLGWRPVMHTVVHDDTAPASRQMDGRTALSRRTYYQVLLDLPKYTKLSKTIPSDQPILFYVCLMKGLSTKPGLGNIVYKDLLAFNGADDDVLAIGGSSDAPALTADEPSDLVIVGRTKPNVPRALKAFIIARPGACD